MAYPGDWEAPLEHRPLSMPTLRELAQHDVAPSSEVRTAILNAATQHNNDPYWVHAEVRQQHRSVTIGQVAIVLLDER
jgi:hypothetical protein